MTVSPEVADALTVALFALVVYAIGWWRGYSYGARDERAMWEWNFPDWEKPKEE